MKNIRCSDLKIGIAAFLFLLIIGMCIVPATAAQQIAEGDCGTQGDNLHWVLYDNYTLIINGTGDMNNYANETCQPWKDYREQVKKIEVQKSATSIGKHAFFGFENLTEATLPDTLTTIGNHAFQFCTNLTSIDTISNNLTTIGDSAFANCIKLTSIATLSDNITTIGDGAFYNCTSLASIYIPNKLTKINDSVFVNCRNLTSIKIPDSVIELGNETFDGCSGLTSIEIPNGVTTIGDQTFMHCTGLKSITIPDSVTDIKERAFVHCTNLTSIKIPKKITVIKEETFCECHFLENVEIPNGVKEIGEGAFKRCNALKTLNIPDSVTKIDIFAFRECYGLENITIPDSVTEIGSRVFFKCYTLESVNLSHNLRELNDALFDSCSLLNDIRIPDGVATIYDETFYNCTNLTSIIIPSSVTSVKTKAFAGISPNSVLYAECKDSVISSNCYSPEKTAVAFLGRNNAYTFTVNTSYFPSNFPLTTENAPKRPGYMFEGWYANPDYSGDKKTTVENGQTLYANWTSEPEKKFSNTSGTIVLDPEYVVPKIDVSNTKIESITFSYDQSVVAPTSRNGYHDLKAFGDAFNISCASGNFDGGKAKIYFNIRKTDLGTRSPTNIVLAHYTNGLWEFLKTVKESENAGSIQFSAETTSFSPFYSMYMVKDSQPVPSSSGSRQTGYTQILQEVPTVTPTAEPTATPTSAPTVKPTTLPTQTQKSPAPLAGLIAGLSTVALIHRLRR